MPSKILVIDDDSRIHSLIRTQFDPQHFEISSSFNGMSGLDAANEQNPDLILLDVDLPATHGFEVCRRLKTDRATQTIPIIFLTSSTATEAIIFGLECGASDYLAKPFRPMELQARVRAALRTKARIETLSQRCILDELTDMPDRNYFEMRLDAELAVSRRSGRRLGCMLLDVDGMDLINVWIGRKGGDEVLKSVGRMTMSACRREDVVCRFEKDTFGVLVGDTTMQRMSELAERTRLAVSTITCNCESDRAVPVTASTGFAISRFSTGFSVVNEALDALDRAQSAGGDCVRAGTELTELQMAS